MSARRNRIRLVHGASSLAIVCLLASSASGQSLHFLSAAVGQSTATTIETTSTTSVNFVDVLYQNGVPGTNPNARVLAASVDSASGVLLTSGLTTALQVANRGRAVSQLEQRMFIQPGGTVPVVIEATLLPIGSASGGFIELDASLQVGPCIAGVRRYDTTGGLPSAPSSSGCSNTAAVQWNVTTSAGLLRIVATYTGTPSAVNLRALVSGDFGGSVSDIPDGQFTNAGALSISTPGNTATFGSPGFLTLPEPGSALLPGVLGLVFAARGRRCSGWRANRKAGPAPDHRTAEAETSS